MGSDYSASVLPFCSLHAFASQWLPRCSFGPFVPQVLPLLSRLLSHPFLPVLLTWLRCSFPFALPCFAPTAVPQVLAFFPVPFVPLFPASCFLTFRSFVRPGLFASATQLSRSSFPLLPSLALRRFVRCSFASFVAPVFLFPPGWFPILLVRFRLLGPLPRSLSSFPVHLPQLTSRCWPCSPLPFVRFLFRPSSFLASAPFRSLPLQALTTQVPVSSVPFFPASPLGGSFRCSPLCFFLSVSALLCYPLLPQAF